MQDMVIGGYGLYAWGMMIILFSFAGFLMENIWIALRFGYMDNRNMNLPFLLGYGAAVVSAYALYGLPIPGFDLLYYLKIFFSIPISEIILGTVVEKLCGFYYWDYTSLPFHVTRYTSLFTSMGLAILGYCFMAYSFTPIMDFFQNHTSGTNQIFCVILLTGLVADFFASFQVMYKRQDYYQKWRIEYSFRSLHELRKKAG